MCMSNVGAKWDFVEILIDSWALPFCTTAVTSSGLCLWECICPRPRSGACVLWFTECHLLAAVITQPGCQAVSLIHACAPRAVSQHAVTLPWIGYMTQGVFASLLHYFCQDPAAVGAGLSPLEGFEWVWVCCGEELLEGGKTPRVQIRYELFPLVFVSIQKPHSIICSCFLYLPASFQRGNLPVFWHSSKSYCVKLDKTIGRAMQTPYHEYTNCSKYPASKQHTSGNICNCPQLQQHLKLAVSKSHLS